MGQDDGSGVTGDDGSGPITGVEHGRGPADVGTMRAVRAGTFVAAPVD
ncbi:hypothetical protein ACF1G0_05420 [Streptomyces sp. NPDC013953]